MVAAQRLKKPGSVPRPFYRFGEPVDIDFRPTTYDQAAGADCTRGQTRSIYIQDRGLPSTSPPPVRGMSQIFCIPD